MKLNLLFEDVNFLFVDDEYEEIIDVPWDSGITPRQALEHITTKAHPEITGSYDVKAIRYLMERMESGHLPEMAVTVDDDMDIIDGYHRIVAAKILGIQKIPYKMF